MPAVQTPLRLPHPTITEQRRMRCLRAVHCLPGQTAAEIAMSLGMERYEPSRRLPELRQRGLIISGPTRTCLSRGTRAMTWWPIEFQGLFVD